jgi:pSer/pThr/pTyr-binding forkhead associated (FHA) protein
MAQQRPQSPKWAQQPTQLWSLVEIKNGVEVAVHDLNEISKNRNTTMIMMGRAEDQVDVTLQHESISRFHARISFDKEFGTPWLRDLSSTHGVFVNKVRLPSSTIGREETMSGVAGSRGVTIYPGDIIQLGASTRYFCVVGPPEFERHTLRHQKMTTSRSKENSSVVNAGTIGAYSRVDEDHERSDDDDFDNGEDHHREHILSDETIPDTFRIEWERIKALQFKLENVQRESERIRMKGDVGSDALSSGQTKQLERNDERVIALQQQIHTKESELYQKIYPTSSQTRKTNVVLGDNDDEENDDYLDRTKVDRNDHLELNQDGETEQTLLAKWNDLHKRRSEISNKLNVVNEKASRLKQTLKESKEQEETFFIQNEVALISDTQQKLVEEEKQLAQHLNEIEVLIRIANPKLRKVGDASTWLLPIQNGMDNDAVRVQDEPRKTSDEIWKVENTKSDNPLTQQHIDAVVPDSAERQQQSSNSTLSSKEASLKMMLPPPPKRQRIPNVSGAPKNGTLAALTSSIHPSISSQSYRGSEVQLPPTAATGISFNNEQQKDTWQIPKDQDGSGRTKLNTKFAGRY